MYNNNSYLVMLSIHEQGKFETWNKTNLVRVNPILETYILVHIYQTFEKF